MSMELKQKFQQLAAWNKQRQDKKDPTLYPVVGHAYNVENLQEFLRGVAYDKPRNIVQDVAKFNEVHDLNLSVTCSRRSGDKPYFSLFTINGPNGQAKWLEIEMNHHQANQPLTRLGLKLNGDGGVARGKGLSIIKKEGRASAKKVTAGTFVLSVEP